MTPTALHTLVAPLWAARPECRPTRHDYPLTLAEDGEWQYGDRDNDQWFPSVDDEAAERIEWHVDRLLQAEATRLGLILTIVYLGEWYIALCDHHDDWPVEFRSHNTDCLAAKVMLAKKLLGI